MEILKSNKGGSKLCFEGYMYTRHALRKTKQWWKCTMKSSRGCRGSLSTDLQHNNPVPGQPHNHSPEESSVNLTRLRNNMQEKALSTRNAPSQIVAECVSTTSNAVKSMLPAEENCKRSIRRHRPQLPSPSSLQLLSIPPEFAVTLDEDPQPFLFYDNGPDARTRVIAFATEDNLRHLATADTLYMDTAPPLFKQIFTIRVPFGNTHITVVYSLLQKKTRQAYEELFQAVIDKCNNLGIAVNITKVFTDFEDALAFLPTADLQEGIAHIRSITPCKPVESEDLVDYFDTTYVSGNYRPVLQQNPNQQPQLTMRRVPPMFQSSVWSVHNATMEGNPRTNNVCEGWNNKFHTLVGSSHLSIWTVIKWFHREQSTVTTIVQQDSIGTQPAKRVSQKLVLLQKRIQNLCHDRMSGRKTVPEFLHGIACNIRLSRHTTAPAAELDISS